jgi:Flp pilus assembly pilin Flp
MIFRIYNSLAQAQTASLRDLREEEGQTMAEYGVILAVITVGIIAAITALSGGIQAAIGEVVRVLTP